MEPSRKFLCAPRALGTAGGRGLGAHRGVVGLWGWSLLGFTTLLGGAEAERGLRGAAEDLGELPRMVS